MAPCASCSWTRPIGSRTTTSACSSRNLCQTLDLQLLIAAPEVARAEGNTTYRLVRAATPDGRERGAGQRPAHARRDMIWRATAERLALLELLVRGTLKRRQAQGTAWDTLAELPWTRQTGRRGKVRLVEAHRHELVVAGPRVARLGRWSRGADGARSDTHAGGLERAPRRAARRGCPDAARPSEPTHGRCARRAALEGHAHGAPGSPRWEPPRPHTTAPCACVPLRVCASTLRVGTSTSQPSRRCWVKCRCPSEPSPRG